MSKSSDISLKSIVIGLILVVINAYWIGVSETLWHSVFTAISLFFNAVFSLFALILLNSLSRRFLHRSILSQGDLLLIYIMICMVSTISGHTMMTYLIGILAHPFWFATVENDWEELFWRYIPEWFTVRDESVLRGYFEGESTLYTAQHIRAWLTPVLSWSAFITVLFFVLICINVIIRKQWVEKEKLSYPIIQLPLEMVRNTPSFFRNRLMWSGFAIGGGIIFIDGLAFLFPAIPRFPRVYDIGRLFTEKPWNAVGWTLASFAPFAIGLTFFMPLDLSFSYWFFYLLGKAEMVFASAIGWQNLHLTERRIGAWIGIGMLAIWISRRHLGWVLKKIAARQSNLNDSGEPMRYRSAILWFIVSMTFLTLFCYEAGMSIWAICLFFVIYFLIAIAVARVRAEIGPPCHELTLINPRHIMVTAMGTRMVGAANLTILSFLYAFNRCNRAHPMPNQLEGFKIAERTGMNNRKVLSAMVLAIAVGAFATFWSYLHIMYKYGATTRCYGSWIGWESFDYLQRCLTYPKRADFSDAGFMGIGMIFTFFLMLMRKLFLWWPFHPVGYVLSTVAVRYWCPALISFIIKWILIRHGGLRTHRKAIPFFLGLVLGDYMVQVSWNVIGLVFGIPVYRVGMGD